MHESQAPGQAPIVTARPAPVLYTVDELAAILRVNPFSIYTWVREAPERLPRAKRIAGRILFLVSDVEAFIAHPPEETSRRVGARRAAKASPRKPGRPTKVEAVARRGGASGAIGGAA